MQDVHCSIDAAFEESCTKEEEECVICMDRKATVILPCAHAYCEQCIEAWLVIAYYFSQTIKTRKTTQLY